MAFGNISSRIWNRISSLSLDIYIWIYDKLSIEFVDTSKLNNNDTLSSTRPALIPSGFLVGLILYIAYLSMTWANIEGYSKREDDAFSTIWLSYDDVLSPDVLFNDYFFFWYLRWILILFCWCNVAWILFYNKKTYQLFYVDPTIPLPQSPNLVLVQSIKSSTNTTPVPQHYLLTIWQPSISALQLLAGFSPIHIMMIYFYVGNDNMLSLILVSIGFSIQALILINMYSQSIIDRQLFHTQLLREYDLKFVYPRTSRYTLSRGTGTSDIEKDHPLTPSYRPSISPELLISSPSKTPLQRHYQDTIKSKDHVPSIPKSLFLNESNSRRSPRFTHTRNS